MYDSVFIDKVIVIPVVWIIMSHGSAYKCYGKLQPVFPGQAGGQGSIPPDGDRKLIRNLKRQTEKGAGFFQAAGLF